MRLNEKVDSTELKWAMQQNGFTKQVKLAAWASAVVGVWLLWLALIILDPNWHSKKGLGPLVWHLPPLVRTTGCLLLGALLLLAWRYLLRAGRSDNVAFDETKIGISSLFGWRDVPWQEVAKIGYRFEPVPIIIVHRRAGLVATVLLRRIATSPSPERLRAAIDYIGKRFPKLLEEAPFTSVVPTNEQKMASTKAHIVSTAIMLPLLVVMIVLGRYDKNLQLLLMIVLLVCASVYSVWLAFGFLRNNTDTDNQVRYIFAGLMLAANAAMLWVAFDYANAIDWDSLAILLAKQ